MRRQGTILAAVVLASIAARATATYNSAQLVGSYSAQYVLTSNVSISSGGNDAKLTTWTKIHDNGGLYSSANSRWIVPVAGRYYVWAQVFMNIGVTNHNSFAKVYVNGSQKACGSEAFIGNAAVHGSCGVILSLAVNDYVEIYTWQNTGGAVDAVGTGAADGTATCTMGIALLAGQ